jgi:hypothetical protein
LVATSEAADGVPIPVIVPPVIATVPEFWSDIDPRPRLLLHPAALVDPHPPPISCRTPKVGGLAPFEISACPEVPPDGRNTTLWVVPLTRTNAPEAVVQTSPSTGVVGAPPGGTRSPAPAVVEGAVISGPSIVSPARFSGT